MEDFIIFQLSDCIYDRTFSRDILLLILGAFQICIYSYTLEAKEAIAIEKEKWERSSQVSHENKLKLFSKAEKLFSKDFLSNAKVWMRFAAASSGSEGCCIYTRKRSGSDGRTVVITL